MPNGQRAVDVRHHVAAPVVQVQGAHPAAAVQATVAARAAQAALAGLGALSVHRPAHHAAVRLRVRLARGHAPVAVARAVVRR